MKSLHGSSRVLVLLLALGLGGCVETRFEAPLGDNIESCDVQWKGLWVEGTARREEQSASNTSAFLVDEDCRFLALDQPERGGPLKPFHVPLNYVHDRGKDYIVVSDAQLKGYVKIDPPYAIDPPPEKSFFFARYRLRGDQLDLYDVDSEKVAKLVIDAKLEGTINKTSSELHVYVRGNRSQMLELVRKHSIFVDKPTTLVRSRQTLPEFEQGLIERQRKEAQ